MTNSSVRGWAVLVLVGLAVGGLMNDVRGQGPEKPVERTPPDLPAPPKAERFMRGDELEIQPDGRIRHSGRTNSGRLQSEPARPKDDPRAGVEVTSGSTLPRVAVASIPAALLLLGGFVVAVYVLVRVVLWAVARSEHPR